MLISTYKLMHKTQPISHSPLFWVSWIVYTGALILESVYTLRMRRMVPAVIHRAFCRAVYGSILPLHQHY